jgi:hypothetical protein
MGHQAIFKGVQQLLQEIIFVIWLLKVMVKVSLLQAVEAPRVARG